MSAKHTPGLFSGRYFPSAAAAAKQFQYEAALRAANAREVGRFGALRCAVMQREAADLYAAARAAIAGASDQEGGAGMSTATIRVDHLQLALLARRTRTGRWCAYSTHPATGGDCGSYTPWPAHGGPMLSPWFAGDIARLAERTHRQRGAREVRRTWGVGMRALCAEQRL